MNSTWLRLFSNVINDERLRLLSFEDRWHYIAILCCKGQGIFDEKNISLRFRKVAIKLEVSVDELRLISTRLACAGLVDTETLSPNMQFVVERASDLRPSAEVWIKIRSRIFKRDDYTCAYCNARGGRLECDHVIPVSRGGNSNDTNLVTACFPCNRSKKAKLVSEWIGDLNG